MKTQTQLSLHPEVQKHLNAYNSAINGALEAAQKLEAFAISKHLTEKFGISENKAAKLLRQDYILA